MPILFQCESGRRLHANQIILLCHEPVNLICSCLHSDGDRSYHELLVQLKHKIVIIKNFFILLKPTLRIRQRNLFAGGFQVKGYEEKIPILQVTVI